MEAFHCTVRVVVFVSLYTLDRKKGVQNFEKAKFFVEFQ